MKQNNPEKKNQYEPKFAFADIEIQGPKEFVKIPLDEYAELIARSTTLDTVLRLVKLEKNGCYIGKEALWAVLDIAKDAEEPGNE